MERWANVVGFGDRYEISDQGNIRRRDNHRRLTPRPHIKTGYYQVGLSVDGRKNHPYIHRLVCEAFSGPCPEGMECRHKDGDRSNNQSTNLAWGTRVEQNQDRNSHGTSNRGERHGLSKLTTEQVLEIRRLAATGWTQGDLAEQYGVCQQTISDIVVRRKWAWLPEGDPK